MDQGATEMSIDKVERVDIITVSPSDEIIIREQIEHTEPEETVLAWLRGLQDGFDLIERERVAVLVENIELAEKIYLVPARFLEVPFSERLRFIKGREALFHTAMNARHDRLTTLLEMGA